MPEHGAEEKPDAAPFVIIFCPTLTVDIQLLISNAGKIVGSGSKFNI